MTEVGGQPEVVQHAPLETHRSWLLKVGNASLTATLYSAASTTAFLTGTYGESAIYKSRLMKTLPALAKQMGGTISPEWLQQLTNSSNLDEKVAVGAALASMVFLSAGILRTFKSAVSKK